MDYLFSNFLKDINDFNNSKNYWKSLCRDILAKNQQLDFWEVWLESEEKNLEQLDNFPMFSLINCEKTKGLIINQQDPKIHTKWEIVAYTKDSDQYSKTQPLNYLVYNCNLSEESAEIFRKLLEKWIQSSTTKEEIEKFIESFDYVNKPT